MKGLVAGVPYAMWIGYRMILRVPCAIVLILFATTTAVGGDAQQKYLAQARSADQPQEGPGAQDPEGRRLCGSPEGKFKRVTAFPEGEQINALLSGLLSGYELGNAVETVCAAPEARVWEAVKKAAEQLDRVGRRPVVGRDEKMQRIQNGKIREDASLGSGAGAWMDEIGVEVTPAATEGSSKVVVTRRVVKHIAGRRQRPWRSARPNGEIERWVLTQIEDALAAPVARVVPEPAKTGPEPVAGTPTPGAADAGDAESQLRRLQDLRSKNLIGEDEYQVMRKRVLESLVTSATPPRERGASPGPGGTYAGVVVGAASNQRLEMRVTFTLIQTGSEIAGTWEGAGGRSGTVSGPLNGSTVAPLRMIQIKPCPGDFTGGAVIEGRSGRLRGTYSGRDCQGSVMASFTAERQ
jgi:hypothetical protein